MLWAIDVNKNEISADEARKSANYFCKECGEKLVLRRGNIRCAHFSHKTMNVEMCPTELFADRENYMSDWHKNWQKSFVKYARHEVVMKYDGMCHRADVVLDKTKVVVEFQHSYLPVHEFQSRNACYNGLNYFVVWLYDFSQFFKEDKIKLIKREGQKYSYELSFYDKLFGDFLEYNDSANNISVCFWAQLENGQCIFRHIDRVDEKLECIQTTSIRDAGLFVEYCMRNHVFYSQEQQKQAREEKEYQINREINKQQINTFFITTYVCEDTVGDFVAKHKDAYPYLTKEDWESLSSKISEEIEKRKEYEQKVSVEAEKRKVLEEQRREREEKERKELFDNYCNMISESDEPQRLLRELQSRSFFSSRVSLSYDEWTELEKLAEEREKSIVDEFWIQAKKQIECGVLVRIPGTYTRLIKCTSCNQIKADAEFKMYTGNYGKCIECCVK